MKNAGFLIIVFLAQLFVQTAECGFARFLMPPSVGLIADSEANDKTVVHNGFNGINNGSRAGGISCYRIDRIRTQKGLFDLIDEANGGHTRLSNVEKLRKLNSAMELIEYYYNFGNNDVVKFIENEYKRGYAVFFETKKQAKRVFWIVEDYNICQILAVIDLRALKVVNTLNIGLGHDIIDISPKGVSAGFNRRLDFAFTWEEVFSKSRNMLYFIHQYSLLAEKSN